jgi:hypothetical protein
VNTAASVAEAYNEWHSKQGIVKRNNDKPAMSEGFASIMMGFNGWLADNDSTQGCKCSNEPNMTTYTLPPGESLESQFERWTYPRNSLEFIKSNEFFQQTIN